MKHTHPDIQGIVAATRRNHGQSQAKATKQAQREGLAFVQAAIDAAFHAVREQSGAV